MVGQLRLDVESLPHPYPNEPSARVEAWSRITLHLVGPDRQVELLDTQWDMLALAEWFAEHHEAICHDTLLVGSPLPNESLAQALKRLQGKHLRTERAQEQRHAALLAYRRQHSLRFALRGAALPEIIIGCNHGIGEISRSDDDANWAYTFAMADFCRESRHLLRQVVARWISSTTDLQARARVAHIGLAGLGRD